MSYLWSREVKMKEDEGRDWDEWRECLCSMNEWMLGCVLIFIPQGLQKVSLRLMNIYLCPIRRRTPKVPVLPRFVVLTSNILSLIWLKYLSLCGRWSLTDEADQYIFTLKLLISAVLTYFVLPRNTQGHMYKKQTNVHCRCVDFTDTICIYLAHDLRRQQLITV